MKMQRELLFEIVGTFCAVPPPQLNKDNSQQQNTCFTLKDKTRLL